MTIDKLLFLGYTGEDHPNICRKSDAERPKWAKHRNIYIFSPPILQITDQKIYIVRAIKFAYPIKRYL